MKRKRMIAGLIILGLFLVTALAAPFIAPQENEQVLEPFLPPSAGHPLGTNDMGLDILSELARAARVSLTIGLLAATISVFIGGAVGILAGYLRGLFGEGLALVIDVFLLIPMLPLMVVLASYLDQSWWNIILVISLLGWCSTARAVRSKVLQLRESLFVEALRGLGISTWRITSRHMVPHVMEIISAKFVLAVAGAMLSEAAITFIGLGDPSSISWGMMIHYAFSRGGFLNGMWYWYLPPGLCIGLCALGFILIGLDVEEMGRKPKSIPEII